ncbi:MAG: trypsin-like peptidase domain-containing protein [Micropruina sp.]|nr:trypsin-like peptidase domain-containing protein [Micropruina sp.]
MFVDVPRAPGSPRPGRFRRLAGLLLVLVALAPVLSGSTQDVPAEQLDLLSQSGRDRLTPPPALTRGVLLIEAENDARLVTGTGMVLRGKGRALTNYHVVQGATRVRATLADTGETFAAVVVGFDAVSDIAVLQLLGADGLPTVAIDEDLLRRGDAATVVGNAGGHGRLSADDGTVTLLRVPMDVSTGSQPPSRDLVLTLIRTTASAQHGDSGGPMFDHEGEVFGVTTARSRTTGASYAVPIQDALAIVAQVDSGFESARVQIGPSGYLGIEVLRAELGSNGEVRVFDIEPGGPAARVGIHAGDTLLSVGSVPLTRYTDLKHLIRAAEPGDKIEVSWRDVGGSVFTATVVLAASPVA